MNYFIFKAVRLISAFKQTRAQLLLFDLVRRLDWGCTWLFCIRLTMDVVAPTARPSRNLFLHQLLVKLQILSHLLLPLLLLEFFSPHKLLLPSFDLSLFNLVSDCFLVLTVVNSEQDLSVGTASLHLCLVPSLCSVLLVSSACCDTLLQGLCDCRQVQWVYLLEATAVLLL